MAAARRTRWALRSLAWALLIPTLATVAVEAQDADLAELVDARDAAGLRARGPQVMDELAALYKQRRDPEDRQRVAWAFYQLGLKSPAAVEALLPDVEDDGVPEGLRISAQYALGRVGDDPLVVRTLLENMRRGGSRRLRDKAACALAYDQIHLSETQKVELFSGLVASLDDEKGDVRWIAIKALKIHTGQTKGYLPNAPREERLAAMETWQKWLREYSEQL
jgi:HEAT repeat protein